LGTGAGELEGLGRSLATPGNTPTRETDSPEPSQQRSAGSGQVRIALERQKKSRPRARLLNELNEDLIQRIKDRAAAMKW
jgi:hypothetical protein